MSRVRCDCGTTWTDPSLGTSEAFDLAVASCPYCDPKPRHRITTTPPATTHVLATNSVAEKEHHHARPHHP